MRYDVVQALAPQLPDPAAGQQVLRRPRSPATWSSRIADSCP